MDFAHFPSGIFWDPREPPPPEIEVHYMEPRSRYPSAFRTRRGLQPAGGPIVNLAAHVNTAVFPGAHDPYPPPPAGGRSGYRRGDGGIHAPATDDLGLMGLTPEAPGLESTVKPAAYKKFPGSVLAVVGNGMDEGSPLCVLLPVSLAIRARVVQDAAKITLTQTYLNDSDRAIEQGGYTFPLPSHCTVTSFSCRVGNNRLLRAQVKPKEEAKQAFQDAVRERVTAGLLEQATPEVFTTSLGNIPAHTRVKVELGFVMLLKRRFGEGDGRRITTTFTIPTRIAPRFGDAPEGYSGKHASSEVSRGMSLEVEIDACEKVTRIASGSHKITIERGIGGRSAKSWDELVAAEADSGSDGAGAPKQSALVKLEAGSMGLDGDFVLDIDTVLEEGEDVPRAVLEIHPTMEDQAALMLSIPPRLLLKDANDPDFGFAHTADRTRKSEIIFLADRSGSMGDKIESLKSAMQFFLKGIPEGRKFNIWCFGSNFASLWPRSVDYSEASLHTALSFVDQSFRADMGGTAILPAVQAVVAARDVSTTLDVVLLTDGEVWRLEETLEFIRASRRQSEGRVRFFALGVGSAVSHALVEGIATAGGGYSEVVPAHIQNGWEDRVVAMVGAALSSRVDDVWLELQLDKAAAGQAVINSANVAPELPRFLQSPSNLSTLNPFQQSRILMLFNSNSEFRGLKGIVLKTRASASGPERSIFVAIREVEKKDDIIHSLAARAALEDLKFQKLPADAASYQSSTTTTPAAKMGELIGCKFSIISQWTSFFLKEEKKQEIAAFKPSAGYGADRVQLQPSPPQDGVDQVMADADAFIPVNIATSLDVLNMLRPRGQQISARRQAVGLPGLKRLWKSKGVRPAPQPLNEAATPMSFGYMPMSVSMGGQARTGFHDAQSSAHGSAIPQSFAGDSFTPPPEAQGQYQPAARRHAFAAPPPPPDNMGEYAQADSELSRPRVYFQPFGGRSDSLPQPPAMPSGSVEFGGGRGSLFPESCQALPRSPPSPRPEVSFQSSPRSPYVVGSPEQRRHGDSNLGGAPQSMELERTARSTSTFIAPVQSPPPRADVKFGDDLMSAPPPEQSFNDQQFKGPSRRYPWLSETQGGLGNLWDRSSQTQTFRSDGGTMRTDFSPEFFAAVPESCRQLPVDTRPSAAQCSRRSAPFNAPAPSVYDVSYKGPRDGERETTQLERKNQLVRDLLQLQRFDGSFAFSDHQWKVFLLHVLGPGSRHTIVQSRLRRITGQQPTPDGRAVADGGGEIGEQVPSGSEGDNDGEDQGGKAENKEAATTSGTEQPGQQPPSPTGLPLKLDVAQTLFVALLLMRRLGECRTLWTLMATKAFGFVQKSVPGDRRSLFIRFSGLMPKTLELPAVSFLTDPATPEQAEFIEDPAIQLPAAGAQMLQSRREQAAEGSGGGEETSSSGRPGDTGPQIGIRSFHTPPQQQGMEGPTDAVGPKAETKPPASERVEVHTVNFDDE